MQLTAKRNSESETLDRVRHEEEEEKAKLMAKRKHWQHTARTQYLRSLDKPRRMANAPLQTEYWPYERFPGQG